MEQATEPDEAEVAEVPEGKGAEMHLSIRLASGTEVAYIAVRTDETVRSLKKRIRLAEGTPTAQQRLLSGHSVLSNSQSLGEVGLVDKTIIQLVRLMPVEAPSPVVGTAAGDGIVILEEHVDSNYEPTEDEIDEYAEWLGMDPDADGNLLWIAREGLKAPLNDPWRACETSDRELFYFNFETGQSTWDHPIDEVQRVKYRQMKAQQLASSEPQASAGLLRVRAPRSWLSKRLASEMLDEEAELLEDSDFGDNEENEEEHGELAEADHKEHNLLAEAFSEAQRATFKMALPVNSRCVFGGRSGAAETWRHAAPPLA